MQNENTGPLVQKKFKNSKTGTAEHAPERGALCDGTAHEDGPALSPEQPDLPAYTLPSPAEPEKVPMPRPLRTETDSKYLPGDGSMEPAETRGTGGTEKLGRMPWPVSKSRQREPRESPDKAEMSVYRNTLGVPDLCQAFHRKRAFKSLRHCSGAENTQNPASFRVLTLHGLLRSHDFPAPLAQQRL